MSLKRFARRRWLQWSLRSLLILIAVLPPILAAVFYVLRGGPFVSIEAVLSVQTGMSKAEVEAIVGKPNERSTTSEGGEYWGYYTNLLGPLGPEMVELDRSGHVVRTWSQRTPRCFLLPIWQAGDELAVYPTDRAPSSCVLSACIHGCPTGTPLAFRCG